MAKPDLKLSMKLKDGGERVYPVAFWKSDRGDSWNGKLDDGWKIVAPDGTEYTTGRDGNAYFDLYPKRDGDGGPRDGYGTRGKVSGGGFGGADFSDDDGSIPF